MVPGVMQTLDSTAASSDTVPSRPRNLGVPCITRSKGAVGQENTVVYRAIMN